MRALHHSSLHSNIQYNPWNGKLLLNVRFLMLSHHLLEFKQWWIVWQNCCLFLLNTHSHFELRGRYINILHCPLLFCFTNLRYTGDMKCYFCFQVISLVAYACVYIWVLYCASSSQNKHEQKVTFRYLIYEPGENIAYLPLSYIYAQQSDMIDVQKKQRQNQFSQNVRLTSVVLLYA